ncbi:MAG TPA: type II secretion system protein [Persephonella sp.]|nr:type II secretion system protein [Hydrogenothermaceae bacterium]HIQ25310.1 type II secretion system protein [Persephonella sp.]
MNNQKGFTLIELAIVLVVIGIILGAILKSQELIKNAKARRFQNDVKALEAIIWMFYDRYGRFPGDCNLDGLIDASTNNTVGAIDNNPNIKFCEEMGGNEPEDLDAPWAELKKAQLVSNVSNLQLSSTPLGGTIYIGKADNRNAIAIAGIPCFAAKMIDVSIDGRLDGGFGRVRELTGPDTARNSTDVWTTCNTEETLVNIVYFFDREP